MKWGFKLYRVFKVCWDFSSGEEALEVMGFMLGPRATKCLTQNKIKRVDNRVCLLRRKIIKK